MKLILVNDKGDPVACLEDIEGYDAQNSSNVFALLDFLETLIAAAKGNKNRRGSDVSSCAPGSAAALPFGRRSNAVNR
ncbi:MAG: hypothetical protein HYS38_05990 [Acidobacteria bacterium]|nr:hypothetical protein [Acidobacteriota bacterium]